jgi:hypothetical protein
MLQNCEQSLKYTGAEATISFFIGGLLDFLYTPNVRWEASYKSLIFSELDVIWLI